MKEEQVKTGVLHIKIQELFDIGLRAVLEDTEKIIKLKARYLSHIKKNHIYGVSI